ncbi:hypothetical protein GCM10017673_58440 [Streptosporangium violaceochromogenes]|nr:hypothetical protein GCM10017673_58440 [Streptosporangium violaceochromogenes]
MVFGLAGVCVLLALYWSPMWITTVVLWGGAVAFTWVGARTMLGKIKPVRTQDPQPPTSPRFSPLVRPDASIQEPPGQPGPHGMVQGVTANPSPPSFSGGAPSVPMDGILPGTGSYASPTQSEQDAFEKAVFDSTKRVARGMARALIVLMLIVLVPIILLLAVIAVVLFFQGEFLQGAGACAVVAFMVWYCSRPLMRFWEWEPFIERDD